MEEKIKRQLKLSSSTSSSISMEDDEEVFLYETIEAPKFVDFTRPNHYFPDDRYWFCSRVGCDRKHEEEIDLEAISKDFVLRVMAARSPNVRLRKALIRKPPSESKKCPLSAPPKPSKSRLPRLALVSSVCKKLIVDQKSTNEPSPAKPSSTPKTRVKHVAAKYMTSLRKKKGSSPKVNAFRSVRNTNRVSTTIPKNKVVAKALVFNSSRKGQKVKTPEEMATPITKLCEGIKKLEIASQQKVKNPKPSKECKKFSTLLPSDGSRKKPGVCKAKLRQDDSCSSHDGKGQDANSSMCVEAKPKQHDLKARDDSSDMEIDGKFRVGSLDSSNTSSSLNQEVATSEQNRPFTVVNSDAPSVDTLTSETVSCEDRVLVPKSPVAFETSTPNEIKKKKGDVPEGENENQNARVLGELSDNDDKENASNLGDISNLCKPNAPVKHKTKTRQTQQTVNKTLKENCSTGNGAQAMKYRKLKPTNPKPFRLRTDERGILKDTTLERKTNSHEKATIANDLWRTTYGMSINKEKEGKKVMDKTFRTNQLEPVRSNYKNISKEVEPKTLDRVISSTNNPSKTRSSSSHKQLARPHKGMVSNIKSGVLGAIKETTTLKLKETREIANPRKQGSLSYRMGGERRRPATISKEPNFQSLHKPKSCIKT